MFALVLVCLATLSFAQVSDQLAAARVLGPHWRQISRSAGMVFSGTVLGIDALPVGNGRPLPLILTKFRVDRAIIGVRTGELLTVREWAGAWYTHRAMRGGERLLIFLYPPSRLRLTSPVGGPAGQVVLDSRGEMVPTSPADAGNDSAALAARPKSCPPENLRSENLRSEPENLRSENPRAENLRAANLRAANLPDADFRGTRVYPEVFKRSATRNSNLPIHCTAATQPTITLRQLERAIRSARKY